MTETERQEIERVVRDMILSQLRLEVEVTPVPYATGTRLHVRLLLGETLITSDYVAIDHD